MRPWAKWLMWGLVIGAVALGSALAADALAGVPSDPWLFILVALLGVVPAVWSTRSRAVSKAAPRALAAALRLAAVVAIVAAVYGIVVLASGKVPTGSDGVLLAWSAAAAVVATEIYRSLQQRVESGAARLAGSNAGSAIDIARTFGARMSRSIPLDELVLQAAESLRSALDLQAAEVWTLDTGFLRPWIGDPDIARPPVDLRGMDPATVVQAGVSGPGWLQVWLPDLLTGRDDTYTRMAPMAHAGELQGVVVMVRSVTLQPFAPDEERTLAEIARQLGVTLHNAKLDSALQASLDEVRRQADELQASRGRIVAASDAARRQIERNLHDGAQQHIVALAVKLRLARQLMERDPDRATATLDELSGDIDGALQELRDLAHGIYPPLLADKGLVVALESVARKAPVPTRIVAADVGRLPPDAEATAYFCCLEALQNVGKYGGDGATATVDVRQEAHALVFSVTDDGAGFDVGAAGMGAGFTNMNDRLGALGGTLRVESAPGKGTRVTGVIPVRDSDAS
jgi:signal transduction histidine kinase